MQIFINNTSLLLLLKITLESILFVKSCWLCIGTLKFKSKNKKFCIKKLHIFYLKKNFKTQSMVHQQQFLQVPGSFFVLNNDNWMEPSISFKIVPKLLTIGAAATVVTPWDIDAVNLRLCRTWRISTATFVDI